MQKIKQIALQSAWLLALIAVIITLYLSEIKHWPICHLCWYQRICLFPMVILLGMATYKGTTAVVPYCRPLLIIGLLIAAYQVAEQYIPALQGIGVCGQGPSCGLIHMQWLGFITLPLISAFGFFVLLVLTSIASRKTPTS